MAEPWIRVHANISEKRVSIRASEQLKVSINEAIGLLVRFWGAMSRLGDDGMVAPLTDREIETWAGWRGKRGAFAAFVRETHTDAEGRVNEWDEYQGALEHRRANDRDRQRRRRDLRREQRGTSRGTSADDHAERPRDNRDSSAPARANDTTTKRDETVQPAVAVAPIDFARALAIAANRGLAEHATRPQPIPRVMPDAGRSLQVAEDLIAEGVSLDFATAEIYRLAKEHDADGLIMSLRYFVAPTLRAWQRRSAKSASDEWTPPSSRVSDQNGAPRARRGSAAMGGARNDAAIDAWLADKERARAAGEDVVEPEPEEINHGE